MSVQRSEIYFVNLNPVQGREQAGERPKMQDIETVVRYCLGL